MDTRLLNYIPVRREDPESCSAFRQLMHPYIDELNQHMDRPLPEPFREKWIDSIISLQGTSDRHLELLLVENSPIGFLYGKVDHPEHKGYIRPGWGYIMEFYIRPEYRRQGLGREMFRRLEKHFREDGITEVYLTADPVTGRPFWEALGFQCTQARSPDNGQLIYIRRL